jgi:hypothetical protein
MTDSLEKMITLATGDSRDERRVSLDNALPVLNWAGIYQEMCFKDVLPSTSTQCSSFTFILTPALSLVSWIRNHLCSHYVHSKKFLRFLFPTGSISNYKSGIKICLFMIRQITRSIFPIESTNIPGCIIEVYTCSLLLDASIHEQLTDENYFEELLQQLYKLSIPRDTVDFSPILASGSAQARTF